MILKIGDLDLYIKGQVGLQTSKIFIYPNFSFLLALFVKHLNVLN